MISKLYLFLGVLRCLLVLLHGNPHILHQPLKAEVLIGSILGGGVQFCRELGNDSLSLGEGVLQQACVLLEGWVTLVDTYRQEYILTYIKPKYSIGK